VAAHERQILFGPILLSGMPAFIFGLAEDLTKRVSVRTRLLATLSCACIGWYITGHTLTSLDIPGFDALFESVGFCIIFTAFAVGGLANAVNISDGFNGMASGFVVIALTALGFMAMTVGDTNLAYVCIALGAAFGGFFVVNWPMGRIFLGDGGAYFGGFVVAWLSVLLVERNGQVTPFAAQLLMLNAGQCALARAVFMLCYITVYARLVRFHWCSPLVMLTSRPGRRLIRRTI
jgi:UDP-N-acetylmuramyl pentapeptide phosphotransferase/UDP-N-acetylglucosamine-1-phosphate transferase